MKSDRQTSRDGWMCKQPWFIAGLQSHGGMSACVLFLCFYKVFYMCICPHVRGGSLKLHCGWHAWTVCACVRARVCVCINSIVSLLEQDSEFLWVTGSVTLAGERGWGEHRAGTFSVICRTAGWEEWVRRRGKKSSGCTIRCGAANNECWRYQFIIYKLKINLKIVKVSKMLRKETASWLDDWQTNKNDEIQ